MKRTPLVLKIIVSIILFGSISLFAEAPKLNQFINKNAGSGSGLMESWDHFGDTDIKKPSNRLSSIVVFRPLNKVKGPAVNLFIDGEYHASVLPGAYTQASFCAGTHNFSVAYTNVLTKYKEKTRVDHKNVFMRNTITYYKIYQGNKGKLHMQLLDEDKALAHIKKLPPRQKHTISRISKRHCPKGKELGEATASVVPVKTSSDTPWYLGGGLK